MSKSTTLKHTLRETDLLLYITCILTSAFGALMVYSATMNAAAKSGLTLSRDCLIMICASALGIILCAFISLVEYNAIISLWPIAGGVCLLLLYAVVTVIRNIIEPKIVGQQVGLHPLVTLLAMVVGVSVFGGVGMLGLPVAVAVVKQLNDDGAIHLFK